MRVRVLLPVAAALSLAAPAAASADFAHTVAPGESLYSVAAADGLSVDQLAAANGVSSNAQLVAGGTLMIPPQSSSGVASSTSAATPAATGDGDGDSDDVGASATATAPTSAAAPAPSGGSYVVQHGDTLSAIAARAGMSVSELAAANGLDPNGLLRSGVVVSLAHTSVPSPAPTHAPAPTQAPAVGTSIVGHMTWFGGPHDASAQGVPASGLGWRSDGMSFYNYGSLGHRWLIRFPWGQTTNMSQIDIGPAPWTGNPFDIAFSALPNTPYNWQNWPNPIVTGTYQGG